MSPEAQDAQEGAPTEEPTASPNPQPEFEPHAGNKAAAAEAEPEAGDVNRDLAEGEADDAEAADEELEPLQFVGDEAKTVEVPFGLVLKIAKVHTMSAGDRRDLSRAVRKILGPDVVEALD